MFNPTFTENAAPAGFGVLELIADPGAPDGDVLIEERAPRPRVVPPPSLGTAPLERTELRGTVTGPLASLRLVQRFRVPRAFASATDGATIEARYRFPLPGDAAVLGVVVRFGDVEVRTTLAARDAARATYGAARAAGHQAALLEREAPNVFTLSVTGLRGAESVEVETRYVQRAALAGGRWSIRVPLTTAPRFVRADETGLPQASANPLATLRDPGHRFALDLALAGAAGALAVTSPTHALRVEPAAGGSGLRVRLRDDDVIPDRDCVLEWRPADAASPALHVVTEDGPGGAHRYVLALVTPSVESGAALGVRQPRDLLLLVDRSGSMDGAKWEATRWAVRRVLAGLAPTDRVQLGLFDDETVWLDAGLCTPDASTRARADAFLQANGPRGGTELGPALEAALVARPRTAGAGAARHCLVITDGQVTDEARILATLDREATRIDARRVSVLCIDSAPNASLAVALAERGRGTAHFLSSDPSDGDVATALEDVLEGFDAPLAVGLTLGIDGAALESPARPVVRDGGTARVDLGDLVAGRPAWVVVRLPASQATGATLRVRGHGVPDLVAALDGVAVADGGVRAAFGAERVRVLEQLAASGAGVEVAETSLRRLGYDLASLGIPAAGSTVYAENAQAALRAALQALLVRESLEAGVPSTATAFVAVREVAGRVVERTVDIASALPAGWSHAFEDAASYAPVGGAMVSRARMPAPMPLYAPASPMPKKARASRAEAPRGALGALSALGEMADTLMESAAAFVRGGGGSDDEAAREEGSEDTRSAVLWDGVPPIAPNGEIALFDSDDAGSARVAIPEQIVRALVQLAGDAAALPNGAQLLLYVGDLARPVARIALAAALAAGGERPLNVRRARGERVRLVLQLGAGGAWPAGAGRLTVSLGG